MKKLICCLGLMSLCFSAFIGATVIEGARFKQSEEAVKFATHGHIDAKGLKALMDADVPFVLLDARGKDWNDPNIIPGAKMASNKSSTYELQKKIPNLESLVIVYCYSFTCPYSPRLIDHLIEKGYVNVIEYPGGLKEWRDTANYPVETIYRTQ